MPMIAKSKLRGVYAPLLTPVKEDLSPDLDRLLPHCQWLLANGCHGLVPFGTTSEANSFSCKERIDTLDGLLDKGIDPGRLLVGTGTCSLTESFHLTSHAVESGCAGVLMLPPFYYKGVSEEGLFRSFSEIIERVSDDRLEIYLYHIPKFTGMDLSHDLIQRLLETYPETVVGIKDSSGDLANSLRLLERFPGFSLFSGTDDFILETLHKGGVGCITGLVNINVKKIRDLFDHWESSSAQERQDIVTAIRHAVLSRPIIPALKEVIAKARRDEGWRVLRPPLVPLPEEEAESLFDDLERAGFPIPAME